MKKTSISPVLSRMYDNNNKLDSQLTIISQLLSTGDVENQEIISATNIAWDINHNISIDISEVINSSETEKINKSKFSPIVEREDIKEDIKEAFSEIYSMMAGVMSLNGSGFTSGDLGNVLGVTLNIIYSLEKKMSPLLAD
ncbi:Uncharacterised protein [Yersinia enterocolitica]|nr:Uncharacterised protein [Yersinia enterocolitica]